MVDEVRAGRLDLAARAKFVREKQPITESRPWLMDLIGADEPEPEPIRAARAATNLSRAADNGFVEVG